MSTAAPSATVVAAAPAPTQLHSSPLWARTRHFIAGYASGAALVMVGHPFDLVKVRLQTEGRGGRFKGPLHCVLSTIQSEGVLSLYKGVTPPLLGTGVVNALIFGMQGIFTPMMKRLDGVPESEPATVRQTAKAAVLSGICISTVVTPMEGVKSRLQVQYHTLGKSTAAAAVGTAGPHAAPLYTGPASCIRYVVSQQGVLGLYRGFLPVMFCRASNYAYFGAYEVWKGVYARAQQSILWNSNAASQAQSGGVGQKPTKMAAIFAGGMSGFSYWFSCYPMDVIKGRMMSIHTAETATIRSTARMIYRKDGLRGFFAGFTPCLARAFPANAAAFLAFEWTMSMLPE